jgi:hypothetical protein
MRGEEGAVFLAIKAKKIGDFLPLFLCWASEPS